MRGEEVCFSLPINCNFTIVFLRGGERWEKGGRESEEERIGVCVCGGRDEEGEREVERVSVCMKS